MIEAEVERYSDPQSFAKEVNLPLLGDGRIDPLPPGAGLAALLAVEPPPELARAVEGLTETRRSLTLRSLLLAGFPEDRECFALGLAIAREWSRRGLKIAVVDLDFWNPTIVRPRPHPNEGFVDVLEFGCSFRRVAWEVVAGSLWVVGPGSYPPEESRIAEHADWERASRNFGSHADVTLFVAPLLHRRGLTGQLSKRMDGVVLASSVQRTGRAELRDAFLELWGSDAPMIGCLGIDAADPAAREAEATAPEKERQGARRDLWTPVTPEGRELWGDPEPRDPSAIQAASVGGEPRETIVIVPEPVKPWDGVERRHRASVDENALASTLEEEIRSGRARVRPIGRSRAGLIGGVAAGLAVAASVLAIVMRSPSLPPGDEVMPAGTERVLPEPDRPLEAGMGAPSPSLPSESALTPVPPAEPDRGAAVAPGSPGGPAKGTEIPAGLQPSNPSAAKPFRVHVASFRSTEKVEEIAASLRARGMEAWVEKANDVPGYYRVFVGRFATEAEAHTHAQWLLQTGWVDRAQAYPHRER
ncbi:MAG TPA: SPOR domain-containing protein [Candidatus Eisenbacteria bacterium]|nr:SPOR domain-containing protein [Candidatus Eisenbacteria bacterium]